MTRKLLFAALIFTACNNSTDTTNKTTGQQTKTPAGYTWSKEDENQFLSDCVDNAKQLKGDTAYIKCNCVLKQMEQSYPTLDSAEVILADTAKAAEFTKNCR